MTNLEKKTILQWFMGRCGDVISNEDYQRLLPELADVIDAGHCSNVEEVINMVNEL